MFHTTDGLPAGRVLRPLRRSAEAARPLERETHVETFVGTGANFVIGVLCDCEIDADHTYAEWQNRFQAAEGDRELREDATPTIGVPGGSR